MQRANLQHETREQQSERLVPERTTDPVLLGDSDGRAQAPGPAVLKDPAAHSCTHLAPAAASLRFLCVKPLFLRFPQTQKRGFLLQDAEP